jgi:hypothetical protein
MFCPGCGNQFNDGIKFCKQCGANLSNVREAMTRPSGAAFDWSKTWVAEMFMSEEEHNRRRGITPEIKRYNEIKAGIITGCVGLGVMIFLKLFMQGIAAQNPEDAEILSRIWIAGIIPLMVGLALIINGMFISKRMIESQRNHAPGPVRGATTGQLNAPHPAAVLPEATDPAVPDFSVAEPATQRMPSGRAARDAE